MFVLKFVSGREELDERQGRRNPAAGARSTMAGTAGSGSQGEVDDVARTEESDGRGEGYDGWDGQIWPPSESSGWRPNEHNLVVVYVYRELGDESKWASGSSPLQIVIHVQRKNLLPFILLNGKCLSYLYQINGPDVCTLPTT